MFKLREPAVSIAGAVPVSKEDRDIYQNALLALEHYYKHGDGGKLTRIVVMLPKSNRRVAMLDWIVKFTVLHWEQQCELDLEGDSQKDRSTLMTALDGLNQRYGKGTLHMASAGVEGNKRFWSMKQDRRTPRYTTSWEDLPVAKA